MPLGVIPMILFWVLRIFGEKSQKEQERKSGQKGAPTSQCREPTPRCSPTPQHGIPSQRRVGTPRVCYGVDIVH